MPVSLIGKTGGDFLKINEQLKIPLKKLIDLYYRSIPEIMNGTI